MKKCQCGFVYNDKNDLERINLIEQGVNKYYCPDCKKYKFIEKIKKE